jgi:hypothetical protein
MSGCALPVVLKDEHGVAKRDALLSKETLANILQAVAEGVSGEAVC